MVRRMVEANTAGSVARWLGLIEGAQPETPG
jgi:hypothetical protein